MPCLFKTEVKNSPIHGKGLFALEDIPKGVVYWVMEDLNGPVPVVGHEVQSNIIYNKEQLRAITDKAELIKALDNGFYYAGADLFIQLRDGTQFTNHLEDWNSQIIYDPEGDYRKMYAVTRKAIKVGDEITGYYGNYLSSEAEWVNSLMTLYIPERVAIENKVIAEGNLADKWQMERERLPY